MRVTVKKGLDEVTVNVENNSVSALTSNALVQALGIPDNARLFVNGEENVTYLEDGDVVSSRLFFETAPKGDWLHVKRSSCPDSSNARFLN